jgi:xylulokinase
MLLVDAAGDPLAPAITWQDRRADEEASWLRKYVGGEQLSAWLGLELPIDAGWPPARLLWWRRHQPELLARAHKVLMARDFLLLRLIGEFCSDAWSAKGLVHLLNGEAPPEYYETLGVAASLAPRILGPTTVAGTVHGPAAAVTGLRIGTPVVIGWSDALCGMAGTGAFGTAGTAFDITGTSEIVGLSGAPAAVGLLHVPASLSGGVSVVYGPTQSGGDSLVWFAHWIGVTDIGRVSALAATAPPGADGVLFLPYLQGERAPIWDSAARGALVGLLRQHGPEHGARAVLEGVAMSVRHILETCGIARTPDAVLRVTGGSSRLDLWNQIRADVTGMRVEVVEQADASCLGAAMLAAVGVGIYGTLAEAGAMVHVRAVCVPDESRKTLYDALYSSYRALYPALGPVFASVAAAATDSP